MNSSTPFSSTPDATDFPTLDPEPQTRREGLPAGFRMRANAHYVDQLETPPRPTLRAIATSAIESDSSADAPDYLVHSVRTHGVLEPLLVQMDQRGRHFRLITGRRRLSAARAAGLREVPCIVHAISDAEASELRNAVREAGGHERPMAGRVETAGWALLAQRDVESALTSIESCTSLLELPSAAARQGAARVITAECRRAQQLVVAMRVLGDGVPLRRSSLRAGEFLERVANVFRDEQRLLGLEPAIHIDASLQYSFSGDDELLLTAVAGALGALSAVAGTRSRQLVMSATGTGSGSTNLEVSDRGLALPESFVRTAFTMPWPVPAGDAAHMMLQAARRIANLHGGSFAVVSQAPGTTLRFQLPSEGPARVPVPDRSTN